MSMPSTGGLAAGGKSSLLGIEIWRDDVNAKGGLLGRPVEGTLYNFDYSESAPRYGLPLIPTIGAKATF